MRKPALATAIAALAAALPLASAAHGVRAHAPSSAVPVRPHAQPYVRPLGSAPHPQPIRHGAHRGTGHPRHPNAHLMPGLVVHPPHKPWHGHPVVVAAPIGYSFLPYAWYVLNVPTFVLDGDTFDAAGVRYRLYGIDAPELGEPLGERARDRLQQLLAMGPVSVMPVAVDVYGRMVADVIVAGLNVAGVLRAEGFAKP